jgi:glycerol-3-phosphate dehydrogenase (NAD(P)+)
MLRRASFAAMGVIKPTGIIGAGAFGVVIANVAATNGKVLLYTRNRNLAEEAQSTRRIRGYNLEPNIEMTWNVQELCDRCDLILPIVPSTAFRKTIRSFAPFLTPRHFVIHGTKGFDVPIERGGEWKNMKLGRKDVHTMSEVIQQESTVLRIGCLSGPNLSSEIRDGQPTATVVASSYQEVVDAGKRALSTDSFQVFGSHELLGAELAGALKNGLAIGSGILAGHGFGKNIQAILLTRGLVEMVNLGKVMGSPSNAFLGSAGIGDLIATATSEDSRNFSLGYRIGKGEDLQKATDGSLILTEGVRTLRIVNQLIRHYRIHLPIFKTLHSVTTEGYPVERALKFLMTYPYDVDVDFV